MSSFVLPDRSLAAFHISVHFSGFFSIPPDFLNLLSFFEQYLSVAAVDGKCVLQLPPHVCCIYYYRHVSC
jgi:hypothetical protein